GQNSYYTVTALLEVGRAGYESLPSNEVLTYSLGPAESACLNDDGTAESGHLAGGANGEMAAGLEPPSADEVTLTKIAVFLTEFAGAPITIKVSADDAGGYPGSSLAQAQYPETMLREGWNILEIPEFMQPSFTDESFFIGVVEGEANNTVGLDEAGYGHSFTMAPGGAWSFMFSGELMFRGIVEGEGTGVDEPSAGSIRRLALGNFPDPFNPETQVTYELPRSGRVTLRVYDLSGRLVRELLDSVEHAAGAHTIPWDGRGDSGTPLPSGVYFARLEAGQEATVNKMVLLK
ncbi:MAG TPA: FlgD immunoglobulin-like domain containing protein, partial [bacterium]|nr:FlgD immunoglobulin-like domain containing protein [bacterium]